MTTRRACRRTGVGRGGKPGGASRSRSATLAGGLALALAVSVLGPRPASAADLDVVLRGDFSVDLANPPSADGFRGLADPLWTASPPSGEAAVAVLDEAAWVFSAMIWGFEYVYTPSDSGRNVKEVFTLTPRGSIRKGDPALVVEAVRLEGSLVIATIAYRVPPAARGEYASWSSAVYSPAQARAAAPVGDQGIGAGDDGLGQLRARIASRRESVRVASREALRAWLRGLTMNKPREVRGLCAFAAVPYYAYAAGSVAAVVRLRASVVEIVPYTVF